ncbi:2-hydroxyacid dehydrogenase [Bordetella sp. BOR01]|uniref:2-hydroxyacid dehydrogenase n=1 Tax=Bordetella sp. BOR01 TaxID=2854779 RepID=UPI001C447943|nr:2-hydroxyacid dehydrogenase [Bordetella sp. BOR01]MBV7483912.1 phosphoglycerate dehydrogenase [Bordetella sp. BOR01]
MIDIVFHGQNATTYLRDFQAALAGEARIRVVPETLVERADIQAFEQAGIIVGNRLDASMPTPRRVRLYQVCAAGYDRIDLGVLPAQAAVCNCHGHEPAIAEYAMAAILNQRVPLADAHACLARGDWRYRAGMPDALHGEIGMATLGLLGYGHIGQAIARRAKAFGMRVLAANRSAVPVSGEVDGWFGLDTLEPFYRACDFIVVSLPLLPATEGLVDAAAFAQMRAHAMLINVGRGPVVDEQALYDALAAKRIGAAAIDTWYQYPARPGEAAAPSRLPFARLDNVVMTPHMSAWTDGTIKRRARVMAANVDACVAGRGLAHQIRGAVSGYCQVSGTCGA